MTGESENRSNASRRPDTRGPRGPRSRGGSNKSRSGNGTKDDKSKEAVALLTELFPEWTEEDLVSLLADLNGDVELACNQIADGQATPWSMAGKKIPKPAPAPAPRSRSNRNAPTVKKTEPVGVAEWETAAPINSDDLTWGVVEPPKAEAASVEVELVQEFQRTVTLQTETIVDSSDAFVKTSVSEVVQETLVVTSEVSVPVVVEEESEDDVYVRLPAISARRQPVLEVEPSAVVLPFSVPIKANTGISFKASPVTTNKMVFGESKTEAASSPSVASSPAPQKVYTPEELFASTVRPSGQHSSPYATTASASTTTSVDAAGTPPGLVAPKHQYHQQQHSSRVDYEVNPRRAPQGYYAQQRYDAYQPHGYAQRYTPYSEEAYGAPQSAYYAGSAAAGRQQAGAGFYQHPHHHQGQYHPHAHLQQQHHQAYAPAPHLMYGNDSYGAAAFAAQPVAPGTTAATRYQSQSPQHSATQQPSYSPPGASGRSRMF